MCTLYKGVPNGLAQIEFKLDSSLDQSFEGLGIFTDGKLHNGPLLCIKGTGKAELFELMINGRPADGYHGT